METVKNTPEINLAANQQLLHFIGPDRVGRKVQCTGRVPRIRIHAAPRDPSSNCNL